MAQLPAVATRRGNWLAAHRLHQAVHACIHFLLPSLQFIQLAGAGVACAACGASRQPQLHADTLATLRCCSGDYTIKRRADVPDKDVDCNAKNYKVRALQLSSLAGHI